MRLTAPLKILLISAGLYGIYYFGSMNYRVDQSINARYTALFELKNDPALDSSVNRKRYAQRKAEIYREIDQLQKERHSSWFGFLASMLGVCTGWMIRKFLFSKADHQKNTP